MHPLSKIESAENAEEEVQPELAEMKDSNDSDWENLPVMVFRRLFQYIDYPTKLQLRSVCLSWLEMVELEGGLSVEVNQDKDNMEFAQSVRIKELHITSWYIPRTKTLLPSTIEGLGMYGMTCPCWFRFNMLKEFQFIKKLTLGGKFLSHLALEKAPSLPKELNSEVDYTSLKPSLVFNFLEKLEIIAGSEAFPLEERFFTENSTCLTPMKHNIVRTISHDIAQNVGFILKNIRSTKRLKSFKIDVYQMAGTHLPRNINWRFKPLETFLEAHSETVEELLLPNFGGNNQETHSNVGNEFLVKNLRRFQIYLCCYMTRNRFGGVQNPLYWLRVLLNQTHLEHLDLEMVSFPNQYMDFLMSSVMWKNRETLKTITLELIPHEWNDINGNLFHSCSGLETLKILKAAETTDLFAAEFKNLHRLPTSLKNLELTGVTIEIPKRKQISNRFINFQKVVLQVVCVDTACCYERNLGMLLELMNSRSLEHLDLYIAKPPVGYHLPLKNIKKFVYSGRLFDECILSNSYTERAPMEFGIRILLTHETAKIHYAASICNLNPKQRQETEKLFCTTEQRDNIADNGGGEQMRYNDDQLIAMIVEDLVL